MKHLTCEMCGSTDFVKQDGLLMCQSCGLKYTMEEAKKIMIEGTVEVTGRVQVDNSHLIENYLNMARTALDSSNYSEAESYCNKVLELDVNNSTALMYKGTATAWQSTFANLRIQEGINCWKKALNNCSKDESEELLKYTDKNFRLIIIAMVRLAASFLEDGINEYKSKSYVQHIEMIDQCVILYGTVVNSGYKIPQLCNEAALVAVPYLLKASEAKEKAYHRIKPTADGIWLDFMKEYITILYAFESTALFARKSEAKTTCYETAVKVLRTMNNLPTYWWYNGRCEARQDNLNTYGKTISEYEEKAKEAKALIQKEYWEDHPDEYKAFLEKEKERQENERRLQEQKKQEALKKNEAIKQFWKAHSAENIKLKQDIDELERKQNSLNSRKKFTELSASLTSRIIAIRTILNADRVDKLNFTEDELALINGQEDFIAKFQIAYEQKLKEHRKLRIKIIVGAVALVCIIVAIIVGLFVGNSIHLANLQEELKGQIITRYPKKDYDIYKYRYYARFNDDGTVSFGYDTNASSKWDSPDVWKDPSEIDFSDSATYSYSIEGWYDDVVIIVKEKRYGEDVYIRYSLYTYGDYSMREYSN